MTARPAAPLPSRRPARKRPCCASRKQLLLARPGSRDCLQMRCQGGGVSSMRLPCSTRDLRQRIAIRRMQPAATEVERIAADLVRPGAAAEPVARFEQQARHAGIGELARRADAGRAAADHDDFGFNHANDVVAFAVLGNRNRRMSQSRDDEDNGKNRAGHRCRARHRACGGAQRFLADGWRVALLDINQGGRWTRAHAGHWARARDDTMAIYCRCLGSSSGRWRARWRRGRRALRPPRRAGQQRRHRDLQAAAGDHAGGLGCGRSRSISPGRFSAPRPRCLSCATMAAALSSTSRRSPASSAPRRCASPTAPARPALAHLTKQQAAELGALGIRVNAVVPGPVDTAMAKAVHTPAIGADYHNQIPLNRTASRTELAEAIFFLVQRARELHHRPDARRSTAASRLTGIGLKTMRGKRLNT